MGFFWLITKKFSFLLFICIHIEIEDIFLLSTKPLLWFIFQSHLYPCKNYEKFFPKSFASFPYSLQYNSDILNCSLSQKEFRTAGKCAFINWPQIRSWGCVRADLIEQQLNNDETIVDNKKTFFVARRPPLFFASYNYSITNKSTNRDVY